LTGGVFQNPISGGNEPGPFPANMTKRNAFRGPGFWNLDGAMFKTFKFTERVSFQFRFEAYNVLNHANAVVIYGFPDNEISNGYVPAFFTGRRNVQIAGKVLF
jgi:hypothetical protein